MSTIPPCPACNSEYAYEDGNLLACPDCGHEWIPGSETENTSEETKVLDANGNELQNGDDVVLTQGLKVKGSAHDLKKGTKVKKIRIKPGEDHNIDCRIDVFGAMQLKSEFVKKA
ncbi:zinc ribbon domain-containing protein YjdM [Kiritimatiellaeota bacterium B1221]|nr:zinc ribbon domain-containing protein YjdM [Kiritimatiellaeota bacterium B1221]